MTTTIEVGGTRRAVDARREDHRWIVTLDGRELAVDVVDVGGRWSMLITPNVVSGLSRTEAGEAARSYEIAFDRRDGGEHIVSVNGHAVPLRIADPRAAFGRRARGSESSRGADGGQSAAVVAPMTGRVVKVLVQPGDAVAARQPLVIVEAMKMENELRAPRAGTVAAVHVSEGASVEAHAVLVVLE